jgi:hypothetical protein
MASLTVQESLGLRSTSGAQGREALSCTRLPEFGRKRPPNALIPVLRDFFDANRVNPLLNGQAIEPIEEDADVLVNYDGCFSVD